MKFEIFEDILPLSNWYDAKKICDGLSNGWRLPTIEELNLIYEENKLGNFGCWSDSVPADNTLLVWSKGFETGNVYLNPKSNKNRVILVRTTDIDKTYWGQVFPHPLAPNDKDINIYKSYRGPGKTLLLGCTRGLMGLADDILDLDPWYDGESVIIGDWRDNKNFYNYIMLDGGLCFTKELCDGVVDMASKHCNIFVARTFNHKLPQHRIAAYFPKREDFLIKPTESRVFDDYTFHIWEF